MRWTKDQLVEYLVRQESLNDNRTNGPADPGPESHLQARCLRYCREHGWPVYHDWSRKKNPAGWPDLFVFLPDGRVVLVELKAASGKLRTEQRQLKQVLAWLGHTIHVVRSFKRFVEVCELKSF